MKKLLAVMLALCVLQARGINLFWGEAGDGDLCDGGNWRLNNSGGAVANQVPATGDNAYFRIAMTNTLSASADFAAAAFYVDTAPQKITINPGGRSVMAATADFIGTDLRIVNGRFGSTGWTWARYPSTFTVEDGGVLQVGNLGIRDGSTVKFLGGGTGELSNVYLGYSGDTGSTMLLSGPTAYVKMVGSTTHDIGIGYGGACTNCSLEITDGAVLEGATVNRTVTLNITGNGYTSGQSVFVHDGGRVTNVTVSVGGGRLVVSNAMFHCTGVTLVGPPFGNINSNGIVVADGAMFVAEGESRGYGQNINTTVVTDHYYNNGGFNNYIDVSGTGTTFRARGILLGDGSMHHRLTVRDGASLSTFGIGIYVGGPTYGGLHHEFLLDRATAALAGELRMHGISNTVRVAGGSVMTMNGMQMVGGEYKFYVEQGVSEMRTLKANRLLVEPGCVVTNVGNFTLDSEESLFSIDNAEVYINANGSRIVSNSVLSIRGENSLLHALSRDVGRFMGDGTVDITVGKKGFVHQPLIFLQREYMAGTLRLQIHADAWARLAGGEITLLTSLNPYVGGYMEDLRTNAVLDSPGAYWLELRKGASYYDEENDPGHSTPLQPISVVLCAPPAPKGTTVLVR